MDVWTMSLPATDATVPATRSAIRKFLADHPRAGDFELIASELTTNAVRHARGPDLTIQVTRKGDVARIEVTDRGSPSSPRVGVSTCGDEGGHGLVLVNALATAWGHKGVEGEWTTVWAELAVDATLMRGQEA